MKLVMTLLVRDEEDIIDANIMYHLEQGVDFIIVTDNLSVDSTPESLKHWESAGRVRVLTADEDNYEQGRWVTRMARMASTEYGADWVLNGDADEFWWPQQGDLKSALGMVPSEFGLVYAERHDFVPIAEDGRPFHARMTVRKTRSLNALGAPLPAKVAHRGHPRITVDQGNHAIRRPELAAFAGEAPIVILHFPLRTYEQFENKIVKGGRAYRRNRSLPAQTGATWRYLYDLYEQGRLRDYYTEQERSHESIAEGLATGGLVQDDRLQSFLKPLGLGAS